MEKPKVEITQSEDELSGKPIELAVGVDENEVHAKCPYCPGIKAIKLMSTRGGPSAIGAPSSMVQFKCTKCNNAWTVGY